MQPRAKILPGSQKGKYFSANFTDVSLNLDLYPFGGGEEGSRFCYNIIWNFQVKRVDYKVDNMEGYAQWSLTRSCETVLPQTYFLPNFWNYWIGSFVEITGCLNLDVVQMELETQRWANQLLLHCFASHLCATCNGPLHLNSRYFLLIWRRPFQN